MSDGISFFSNDDFDKYLPNVMSQTNYTQEEALNQLKLFNGDYIRVIKNYMGIPEKKETKVKSLNQEIFTQIRTKLDKSIKDYREKNPINIEEVITNFQESDEREKQKTKIKK